MSENEEPTHQPVLVARGEFAQRIGLVQKVEAVRLHQKTVVHSPQTMVLEVFPAILGGLELLQDLSCAAHPIEKDRAAAKAWQQSGWADYSGVSRCLSALSPEEAQQVTGALGEISRPILNAEVVLALAQRGELNFHGDLTGRPVSSTGTTYPGVAYGYMGDAVGFGYQVALVSFYSPTYGRFWLSSTLHPGEKCYGGDMSAQEEYQQGAKIHDACYPFGLQGNYLDAAESFRASWQQAETEGLDRLFIDQCRSSYYDALADHEYYNTENYEQAAYYYGLAIDMVKSVLSRIDPGSKALWQSNLHYLQAVRGESIGLHLESQRDWKSAIAQMRRAMHIYQEYRYSLPVTSETEHEHRLLLHSVVGLLGQVCYERGMLNKEKRDWQAAHRCFRRALSFYDRALAYHPDWALSPLSDNYHRWMNMVRRQLESLPDEKLA